MYQIIDSRIEIYFSHVACFNQVVQIFILPAGSPQTNVFVSGSVSADLGETLGPTSVVHMHVQVLSRLIAALVLLLYTSHVIAFPRDQNPGIRQLPIQLFSESPSLVRRLNNRLQSFSNLDGMHVSYITYAHLIPVQAAAVGLQHLYQQVMTTAQNYQLTQQTLSNSVTITIGSFTLTLSSNQLVSWPILHAFALKMWLLSTYGWVSGYTISFVAPSGDVLRAELSVSGVGQAKDTSPSTPKPRALG